jgi:HAD superfamily phosphoserine phosphatase-like hydrolase
MEKVICFDLDGTLIEGTSWAEFNQSLGLTEEEDAHLFEEYKKGLISYTTWIDEIMTIYHKYNPVHKEVIEALSILFPSRNGAEALIADAKEKGYTPVLLSGGVDAMVQKCAERFGIEHVFSTNELVFDEEGYLESIVSMGDEAPAKVALLELFCEKHGVAMKEIICVGDGENDVELFKVTKGIQIGKHQALAEVAWKQVEELEEISAIL